MGCTRPSKLGDTSRMVCCALSLPGWTGDETLGASALSLGLVAAPARGRVSQRVAPILSVQAPALFSAPPRPPLARSLADNLVGLRTSTKEPFGYGDPKARAIGEIAISTRSASTRPDKTLGWI